MHKSKQVKCRCIYSHSHTQLLTVYAITLTAALTFLQCAQAVSIVVVPDLQDTISATSNEASQCIVKCHASNGTAIMSITIFKDWGTCLQVPEFYYLQKSLKLLS